MNDEEPRPSASGATAAYLSDYLDYYRGSFVAAIGTLSDDAAHRSVVPSRWTPIELLSHVLHMEQRWFVWGFLGEDVEAPWGDWERGDPDTRWSVPDGVTVQELTDRLEAVGARTRAVLAAHQLTSMAPEGPRFDDGPTDLGWICLHVLQEYARHAGHLDIVLELGRTSR